MSTELRIPLEREMRGNLVEYRITAASKEPVFSSPLTHNWEKAWKTKPMKRWTSEDVMSWMFHIIEEREHGDIVESKLHEFNVNGATLMCRTKEDFVERDPRYGEILFDYLQRRLDEEEEKAFARTPSCPVEWKMQSPWVAYQVVPTAATKSPVFQALECDWEKQWMYKSIADWSCQDVMAWILFILVGEDFYLPENGLYKFRVTGKQLSEMSESDFVENSPTYGQILFKAFQTLYKKNQRYESLPPYRNTKWEELPALIPIPTPAEAENSSSQSDSDSESGPDENGNTPPGALGGESRKSSGGSRVCRFLRDLLVLGKYPDVLDWLDREKGVFKIKDTKQLAKLWGELKNNSTMTYEKLSRALRYNYESEYLRNMRGRRLIFAFGPKATGWRK